MCMYFFIENEINFNIRSKQIENIGEIVFTLHRDKHPTSIFSETNYPKIVIDIYINNRDVQIWYT